MTKFVFPIVLFCTAAFGVSSSQLKMENRGNEAVLKINLGGDVAKSFYDLLIKAHAAHPDLVKKTVNNGTTYSIGNLYAFNTPPFENNVLLWISLDRADFNGWVMSNQQGRKFNGGFAPHVQSLNLYANSAKTVLEVMKLAGVEAKTANGFESRRYQVGTTLVHCRTSTSDGGSACGLEDSQDLMP